MANYDDTTTVSGSVVSFDNGADEVGAKSCVVTLPASLDGYSSVDVVSAGKNLVALNVSPQQAKRDFGITVNTQTADTLNVTTTGVAYACERLFYSFKKGTYSVKFLATSSDSFTPFISIYRTNGTGVKFNIQPNTITTFTLADDADIDIRLFASGSGDTTVRTVEFSYLQIEAGSTATAYTEYVAPTTYTVNLGRTIYGGIVDVVKGEGTDENGNDFTFEPVTIETSKGSNTFWSEQGSTELTYYKDGYGFTSVTVNKTGKNLLPTQTIVTSGNTHYVGGADSYFFFKKGTYTESNLGAGAYMYWRKKDTTDNNIIHTHNSNSGTFTLDEDCEIRFWYYYVGTQDFTNIQIELGSSPSSYVPYETPTVKTAYLHKVIYGGEVDVIKGTAKPKNLFDVGTKKSDYSNTDQRLVSVENGVITMKIITAGSTYTYRLQNINYVGAVTISATGSVVYSRFFVRFRNADDTSWLSNNDVTISESGWTYNQYYQGWFCQNSKVNASKSITIPSCLYWQLGVGFSSTNVGNEETLSNIMIEKGSTASEYVPHFEPFSFTPISIETDEGENTLFANEGESSITYRKAVD